MSEEQKERAEPQFRMLTELSASDRVWRIMTALVIGAAVSVGGVGYRNLQSQVDSLRARETQRMYLLIEVKMSIEGAADASKEPVKTRLKQAAKKIDDHLKQSPIQEYAYPVEPAPGTAPVRNHNE